MIIITVVLAVLFDRIVCSGIYPARLLHYGRRMTQKKMILIDALRKWMV